MSVIPGHPFDLGDPWNSTLAGEPPELERLFDGYSAAVDWPAALFWRELSEMNAEALVVLSVRESPEAWWRSLDEMVLAYARMPSPHRGQVNGLHKVLERFAGTRLWDDRTTLLAAYQRHNADVRASIPLHRLLEWRATEGWTPLCRALGLTVPDIPFPRRDGRTS
jgi:hypothetical protein